MGGDGAGDWGLGGMLSRTVDRLRTSWVFSTPLQGQGARVSLDKDFRSVVATPRISFVDYPYPPLTIPSRIYSGPLRIYDVFFSPFSASCSPF